MCEIKSMIVLKNSVFCPLDYDSHAEMLEELKIEDNVDNSTIKFIRVELTPADGNIFNHDLNNWELRADQPYKPEWYNEFEAEERCKKELQKWFAERFILNDKSGKTIKDGRFYVKDSSVIARGTSYVVALGSSFVEALDSSFVEAWDNSSVIARGTSSVEAGGTSYVETWENSSVKAGNNSSVKAGNNSYVIARGQTYVEAGENSSVVAGGNSYVIARESSSVEALGSSSVNIPYSTEVKIKGIYSNASVKDLSGRKPIIYVANTDFELKQFGDQ